MRRHGPARTIAFGLVVLAASACDEKRSGPAPAPSGSVPAAADTFAESVDVSGVVAFDLVVTPDGAVLVHGRPADAGGGVVVLPVDRRGRTSGPPAVVAASGSGEAVVELAAATTASVVLAAWRTRSDVGGSILAARGHVADGRWSPAAVLGRAAAPADVRRGQLDVAISDAGRAVVLHRDGDSGCGEGRTEPCAALRFHSLDDSGAAAPGLPLSVPEPCQPAIAGLSFVGERWHYALCSRASGQPETTVFAIQYAPEYAAAVPVLAGCEPEGVTRAGDTTAVVARCGADRRAALMHAEGGSPDLVDWRDVMVRCSAAGPDIATRSMTLPLRGPVGRLAPLLPLHVAPPGARAVWTGASVLVAVAVGRTVELRRHECAGGAFERTDLGGRP